jgi:carbonic anhydrase
MAVPDDRPDSPAEAMAELVAGNQRFVTGTRIHPHQDAGYRASLAMEQRPFAVLFGCSDSRLAAEMIFDCGLGDLFVVRTAGHVLGAEVLASIEYGVTELGAPLVVVLGHDSCGAILAAQAAMDGSATPGPHLSAIIERVTPSIADARAQQVTASDGVAGIHVRNTIDVITRDSGPIATAMDAGRCAVIGMTYRLRDGRATVIAAEPDGVAALLPVPVAVVRS